MSVQYPTPESAMDANLHSLPSPPKANQACLSCRRQKRRCDKRIPACSLCERMGRACDYSDASPAPTAEDFNALRHKLVELESRLLGNDRASLSGLSNGSPYQSMPPGPVSSGPSDPVQSQLSPYTPGPPYQPPVQNRFPAIAFLDAETFINGRVEVPNTHVDIPIEVLEILGDGPAVQVVISDFFDTIHTWMPIISKKRLTRNMLNPMWEAGPDLAFIFICMKLMITRPQESLEVSQNPIYTAAKRFLALMEASGVVSLMVLQGYILIALYEIGQSIYPAAWMTVGSCARYGLLLGIHDPQDAPQLLPHVNTWTEMEERKRTWWGALIIDRYVSVGGHGRFLACEDPSDDAPLPINTSAWDEGNLITEAGLPLSANPSDPVCPFARLCQASHLLGKVLRHHRRKNTSETEVFKEASSLYLDLSELTRQLAKEASAAHDYMLLTAPMALCFSALCCLCDPYACHGLRPQSHTQEEATMQIQAVEGLKTVSNSIKDFSEQISRRTTNSLEIDRVSLFIMDAIYAGAANFAWVVRESGDEESQSALDGIRHCLRRLSGRWRSVQEYLRVLEAQEFQYAVGSG